MLSRNTLLERVLSIARNRVWIHRGALDISRFRLIVKLIFEYDHASFSDTKHYWPTLIGQN